MEIVEIIFNGEKYNIPLGRVFEDEEWRGAYRVVTVSSYIKEQEERLSDLFSEAFNYSDKHSVGFGSILDTEHAFKRRFDDMLETIDDLCSHRNEITFVLEVDDEDYQITYHGFNSGDSSEYDSSTVDRLLKRIKMLQEMDKKLQD